MALTTHFDELLDFPCIFAFKVMGVNEPELVVQVLEVIQRLAPGDYAPQIKPSSKGNYCAFSLPIKVTDKGHIESIYTELNQLELVRHVL
jgi:putative lipoic acid-binding regulatory protein